MDLKKGASLVSLLPHLNNFDLAPISVIPEISEEINKITIGHPISHNESEHTFLVAAKIRSWTQCFLAGYPCRKINPDHRLWTPFFVYMPDRRRLRLRFPKYKGKRLDISFSAGLHEQLFLKATADTL